MKEEGLIEKIKLGKISLAIVKDGQLIFSSKSRGLKDLIGCSQKGLLEGAQVYDSKIGLAAAKLCFWGKSNPGLVYAAVASKTAIEFCRRNRFDLKFGRQVEYLYSSADHGCLYEKNALASRNRGELLDAIDERRWVRLERASQNGVFPLDYYTTSNRETEINFLGNWVRVGRMEMDKGIRVDRRGFKAVCVAFSEVKRGD